MTLRIAICCLIFKGNPAPGNPSTISHPGICEPTDTKECTERNQGFDLEGCEVYEATTPHDHDHDHIHIGDVSTDSQNGSTNLHFSFLVFTSFALLLIVAVV